MKHTEAVVMAVLQNGAHKATKFLSEKQVLRATRRLFGGRIHGQHTKSFDIVLTFGRPNYAERLLLARRKKAGKRGVPSEIHLKFPPKRK